MDKWTGKFGSPLVPLVAGLAGAVLFGYAVNRVGIDALGDGIRRVGWGLAAILGIAGIRFMLRAQCWRLCMPASGRLPFWRAFQAFLAGDAVGNITPLGLAASEPAKVFLTRHHLATRDAVSSLAVDNLVYLGSVLTVVTLGAALMLVTVPSFAPWRGAALAALVVLTAAGLAVPRLLRGLWSPAQGARPAWRGRLAGLRESVQQFSAANPVQLTWVYGIHMGFHSLAMLENYLTLSWVVGRPPTVAQAIIFEALNRLLTLVFKFVPFRIGVDEAASSQLALLLGIPPVAAVVAAVVRKVRNLSWTAVGLGIVAIHPAEAAPAASSRQG